MPWEVVSVEDDEKEKKPGQWEVVSVEDDDTLGGVGGFREKVGSDFTPVPESPTPSVTSTIAFPSVEDEANRELTKYGLSASAAGQRPEVQPEGLASIGSAFKTGLKRSLAKTAKDIAELGAYGDPSIGPYAVDESFARDKQPMMDASYGRMEKSIQRNIAPTPQEEEMASRDMVGKLAAMGGGLVGELPKYATGSGAARSLLRQSLGPITSRLGQAAFVGGADALGAGAVQAYDERENLVRDPGAAMQRLAAGGAANLLGGATAAFNPIIRGGVNAGLGYGEGIVTGGSHEDALTQAMLQGTLGASPLGAEGERIRTFRPMLDAGLDRTGQALRRRARAAEALPEAAMPLEPPAPVEMPKANQPPSPRVEPVDVTPETLAADLGIDPATLNPEEQAAFLELGRERIAEELGVDLQTGRPEDIEAITALLEERGFPKRETPTEPAATIEPQKEYEVLEIGDALDEGMMAEMRRELDELQPLPREAEITTPDGKRTTAGEYRDDLRRVLGEDPDNVVEFEKVDAQRRAEIENRSAQQEPAPAGVSELDALRAERESLSYYGDQTADYYLEDGTMTTPAERIRDIDQRIRKIERDERIKAYESGRMLNMNPVGLLMDYTDMVADKAAGPAIKFNDFLREITGEHGLRAREGWLDQASAAHDLQRRFNISDEDSPYVQLYKGKNLEHRVERKLMSKSDPNSAVNIMAAARKVNALPQSKRMKQIDALLEMADEHELVKTELLDELDGLDLTTPDGQMREVEIGKELERLGDEYKLPGGVSRNDLIAERTKIEDALSPEQRAAAQDYRNRLTMYYHDLLDLAVEAGLTSREAADEMKQKRNDYMPLNRIDALVKDLANKSSVSDVRMNDLTQARSISGSEKDLMDPTENLVKYTARMMQMIDQNTMWQSLADLPQKYPQIPSTMIHKVNPYSYKPGEDEAIFHLLRNGKKETYVAPRDVVEGLQAAGAGGADAVMKMMAASASMLRAGATSLNVPFIAKNTARDLGTAVVREGVWNPLAYIKAAADIIGKNESFDRFVNSGATMSGAAGLTRNLAGAREAIEGTGGLTRFLREEGTIPEGNVATNPKEFFEVASKIVGAPFHLIANIAEVGEMIPRKAVFDARLRRGDSEATAMMAARNVTVDFNKVGRYMRGFNKIIPFLNARMQGSENIRQSWATDPVRTAARTVTVGVMPAIAAYIHNATQYPDVWDNLTERDKESNLLYVLGNARDPETGEFTQVIRIPKSEFLKPVMNGIERYMEYLRTDDPINFRKFAIQTGNDFLPLSVAKDGELDLGEAVRSVTPPIATAMIDTARNEKWFQGGPIDGRGKWRPELDADPEQRYDETTPLSAVGLGKLTGWSPRKIQHFIEVTGGGLGTQLLQGADLATRYFRGDGLDDPGLRESGNRLLRQLGGGWGRARAKLSGSRDEEGLNEAARESANLNMVAMRKAQKFAQKHRGQPITDEMIEEIRELALAEPNRREQERLVNEIEKELERTAARSGEAKALSEWQWIKDLDPDAQVEVVREMLDQPNPDPVVIGVLDDLMQGKEFVSKFEFDANSKQGIEKRARFAAKRFQKILDSDMDNDAVRETLQREEDLLRRKGIITDKVLEDMEDLLDLSRFE